MLTLENDLPFFARLLQVDKNPETGMWLLYISVTILCMAAYRLGFARKLPLLKAAIVYGVLILFCTILTFLATFMPIAEALAVIVVVLGVYRIRRYLEEKHQRMETIDGG
jgi:hypothetical protein